MPISLNEYINSKRYTKNETYTQNEIRELIQHADFLKEVTVLPTTNIKSNCLYFVENEESDSYDIFVYINEDWSELKTNGDVDLTDIDLTDYLKKTDVDSSFINNSSNPVQSKVIKSALDEKANSADLSTVATSGSYNDLSNKPVIPEEVDIVDNLTTDDATKVLSAKQGKLLNDNKVDKVSGKGLSSNDYTTADKNLVETIPNKANSSDVANTYATKTELANAQIDTSNVNLSGYVKTSDIVDNLTTDDASKVLSAKQGRALKSSLATVATSGSYNDLVNKPSIPSQVSVVDNLTTNDASKALSAKQGKALNDVIATKNALFDGFQSDLDTFSNDLDTLNDDLDDLKTDVTRLDGNLTTLDGDLDTLDGSLGTLRTNLINFNSALIQFNNGNTALASDLSTLESNLNTFLSKITSLDSSLSTLDNSLDNVDDELQGLVNDLSVFSQYLTNFEGDMNALETKLRQDLGNAAYNQLNSDLVNLFGAIAKLKQRASTTESAVETAQEDISDAQDAIDEVTTEMVGNGTFNNPANGSLVKVINDTSDSVDTAIENTEELQEQMYKGVNGTGTIANPAQGSLMHSVDENTGNIATVHGDIVTVRSDISDVQDDIDTVQGDITTVQGDVSTIQGKINNIIFHQIEVIPYGSALSSTRFNYTVGDRITILVKANKAGAITTSIAKADIPITIINGDNSSSIIQYSSNSNNSYPNYYVFDYTLTTSGLHIIGCGEMKVTIFVKSAWLLKASSTVSSITYYLYVHEESRTCILYFTGSKSFINGDNTIATLANTTPVYPPVGKNASNETMSIVTATGAGGLNIRLTKDGTLIANKVSAGDSPATLGCTGQFMWNY